MASTPSFKFTVDQELLDAIKAHTEALNRFCEATAPLEIKAEVSPSQAIQEAAIRPVETPAAIPTAAPEAAVQPNPMPAFTMPTAPVQTAPVIPGVQPAAVPGSVPMDNGFQIPAQAGPEITTEMISMAGVSLIQRGVDAGAVLREFGVNSVAELTKDQLVPVATRLRQLGANI